MVGTMCVCVTRCCSMSCSARSASQPSIITTVAPNMLGTASENVSGAAWYSGPVHRCALWPGAYAAASLVGLPATAPRFTPLGRPVVPEV
jgi:hypothetical protein